MITPSVIKSLILNELGDSAAGILIFGSCAVLMKSGLSSDIVPNDIDVGIITETGISEKPRFPSDWDVFFWSRKRWERGFPLQTALARKSVILFEKDPVITVKLQFIREHVLPGLRGL